MALTFTDTTIHRRQDQILLDPRDLIANAPAFTGRAGRTEEAINDMAASLLAVGQLQAIVLRKRFDGNPEPVAGFTRLYAAAKITNECMRSNGVQYGPEAPFLVSCVNRQINDREALFSTMSENDTRTPLTPMDYALFIRTASETHNLTDAEIERGLGKSQGWAGKHRALLNLDDATRKLVSSGELAVSPALVVATTTPEARPAVIELAKSRNGGKTTSAGLQEAASSLGVGIGKKGKPTDADFKGLIVDWMQGEIYARPVQDFLSGILEYRAGSIDAEALKARFDWLVKP